jgi:hypothetical protein
MLDLLFALSFIVPLPFWFILIVFPRRDFTRRWFGTSWFHLGFVALGAMYLFVLVGAMIALIGEGKLSPGSFFSLPSLTALLASPAMVLALWLHLVTMDLAGGFYVYHAMQDMALPGLVMSVILFLVLLIGPVGMLIFALYQILWGMRRAAVARVQMEG